jgi:hypothetical protein
MQASTCFCIADRTRKRSAKAQLADHLLQMLLERLIWMAVQRNPPPNLTKGSSDRSAIQEMDMKPSMSVSNPV